VTCRGYIASRKKVTYDEYIESSKDVIVAYLEKTRNLLGKTEVYYETPQSG